MKFWWQLLSFWRWLKNSVFLSRPFWNFFAKKIFFCFIPIKISQHLKDSKDFSKFWWLPWFPENFWCAYTFATQCNIRWIQPSFPWSKWYVSVSEITTYGQKIIAESGPEIFVLKSFHMGFFFPYFIKKIFFYFVPLKI